MLSAGSSVNKRTRHANKPRANNANNKHKGDGAHEDPQHQTGVLEVTPHRVRLLGCATGLERP